LENGEAWERAANARKRGKLIMQTAVATDDGLPAIGHNRAPLSERIFAEPDATVASVLEAMLGHIRTQHEERVAALSARAKTLAANSKRLPEALDDATAAKALDLLSELALHSERAAEEKDAMLAAPKSVTDALAADCKKLETGLAALEKSIRPLLIGYLTSKLDIANSAMQEGDAPMTSITQRGPSGASATISMKTEIVVVDSDAIPRDLCVPDMALIEKARASGRDVPGVEERECPSLRVYK
jgi:hypothetical protein